MRPLHTAGTELMHVDNFPRTIEHMSTVLQSTFTIASTAFAPGASIPTRYTCDGLQMSPPLTISGAPADTHSLVLIVNDPDVPEAVRPSRNFLHWLVYDIPAGISELPESVKIGTMGKNDRGANAYTGPCPPPQYEPREHRYDFALYALDTTLGLPGGATKEEVLAAMQGHVIAETHLVGRYARP